MFPLSVAPLVCGGDQSTADPFAVHGENGKAADAKKANMEANRAVVRAFDDPFGGGGGNANPFESGNDDPFGGDPFGGGKSNGGKSNKGQATDDPFAASPKKSAARSVRSASAVTATVKSARHPYENAAESIRRRLGETSRLTLVEIPLEDFAQLIAESFDIPVVINRRVGRNRIVG